MRLANIAILAELCLLRCEAYSSRIHLTNSSALLSTALKPTRTRFASQCATQTPHREQPRYPQSKAKPSIRHEALAASSLALSIPANTRSRALTDTQITSWPFRPHEYNIAKMFNMTYIDS
ncbi:hypothetical protein J6590_063090 [Homalodisca vitripennis]|nr:hypothetical protein J6590_063090 [Homalodisca vitripennis]